MKGAHEGLNRLYIGIPCYGSAPAETLQDYMAFAYHLGRRCPEWEVFLGIISKSEQFRARNRMVESAIMLNAKYMLMLDDDMVIDIDNSQRQTDRYNFVTKLIGHIEKDPKIGVCGALYYQRGGDYHIVAMNKRDETYWWLKDDEITGGLQEVTVAGGGAIVINMEIFNWIPSPWFEPEMQSKGASRGTDVQICEKALAAGFKVMLDSSIELGHVSSKREVITSRNRPDKMRGAARYISAANDGWEVAGLLTLYSLDVEEYTGKNRPQLEELAALYPEKSGFMGGFTDLKEYYRSIGLPQLARQYYYHNLPGYGVGAFLPSIKYMVGTATGLKGLDFGCGSAPLGFDLALHGQHMDFVDIDGAAAYEFVKWRAKKHGLECGWELGGPYDFILLMDVLEHIPNWEEVLGDLIGRLKNGAMMVTNYFENCDFENPEHISMDKKAVKKFMVEHDMVPGNLNFWRKEK